MKVYLVSQDSGDNGYCGSTVYASREAAMKAMNQTIDEINDEEEDKQNHLMWPDRMSSWTFDFYGYTWYFDELDLIE